MPEQSPAVERENQRKAKSDKEYSDDFPFPVRVIERPDDAKHAREREQKSDDHEAADLQAQRDAARAAERAAKAGEGQESAAWLAVWIAGLGTAGLLYSLWLTRAALSEARKSSDASIQMAQTMIAVEGPKLQFRWAGANLIWSNKPIDVSGGYSGIGLDKGIEKHMVFHRPNFRNYGRTPAHPISMRLAHAVTDKLPETPMLNGSLMLFDDGEIIKPEPQEDAFSADFAHAINLSDEDLAAFKNGRAEFWIYGIITYRDFLGRVADQGFCGRWAQRPKGEGMCFFASDGKPPPVYNQLRYHDE